MDTFISAAVGTALPIIITGLIALAYGRKSKRKRIMFELRLKLWDAYQSITPDTIRMWKNFVNNDPIRSYPFVLDTSGSLLNDLNLGLLDIFMSDYEKIIFIRDRLQTMRAYETFFQNQLLMESPSLSSARMTRIICLYVETTAQFCRAAADLISADRDRIIGEPTPRHSCQICRVAPDGNLTDTNRIIENIRSFDVEMVCILMNKNEGECKKRISEIDASITPNQF